MGSQLKQQENLPVNLEKAEFIISLASQKTNGFKSMMFLLREIEDQLLARQKFNKTFSKVAHIIAHGYNKKIQTDQQLIKRIQYDIQKAENEMDRLATKRRSLKQTLDTLETELASIRDYAEQRRDKKSKRERQYHQLYHVPILATQFKKKYVRARDKNSDAEEQVSTMRSKVDACQQEIAQISKTMTDIQKHREHSLIKQCKDLESQVKSDKELVFQLQEGIKFINGLDQYQLVTAQQATTQFIESIQSSYLAKNGTIGRLDNDTHFVKVFKLALFEYGEAEKFADNRWGHIQVPYTCTHCKVAQVGWPKLDKVRTNDFICESCYQEHHTAMVIEKRMSAVKDRSQQLLSLPGGSMLSFSSSSTVQSDTQKKPGFKKMVKKMIKGNKQPHLQSGQVMMAQ